MLTKLLLILGVSLGTSFLCSILEAILLSVTHGYVDVLREAGSRVGQYLHRMQRRIDEPIAAILALNTIANTFGAAMGGALALQILGAAWMAAFSAGLTLGILLFSEILPKTLGATLWPTLAPVAAHVLRGLIWVLKPVIVPLTLYARLITPGQERPTTVSRTELQALARIGRREGALDEDEWTVLSSVMSLDEVTVGRVTPPRTDIVAVPVDSSIAEAKEVMLDKGHLRLPVYRETLDRVVGILLARDLWRAPEEGLKNIREVMGLRSSPPPPSPWTISYVRCGPTESRWSSWWTSSVAPLAWSPWKTCGERSWERFRTSTRPTSRMIPCIWPPGTCRSGGAWLSGKRHGS